MKARNILLTGMAVAFSFYGCADLVDVEEHSPEAGECLDCHASQSILEKWITEEAGAAAGGG